jgi:hypothetical protein
VALRRPRRQARRVRSVPNAGRPRAAGECGKPGQRVVQGRGNGWYLYRAVPCRGAYSGERDRRFRVLRELPFNVAKHAGTGAARVVARRAGNILHLQVRDPGSGFDPPWLNLACSAVSGSELRGSAWRSLAAAWKSQASRERGPALP